jgi:hypothetical protein
MARSTALTTLAAIVCLVLAAASAHGDDRTGDETVEIRIPTRDGKVHVRDVLEGICREAGLEATPRLEAVDWTIDVRAVPAPSRGTHCARRDHDRVRG